MSAIPIARMPTKSAASPTFANKPPVQSLFMSIATSPLFESTIKSLPLLGRGKVRDIYAVGDDKLLIVTTDRLSAFDVILPDPIPGKGAVLTAVANFWFGKLAHVVPNQLTGIDPETVVTGCLL